MASSVSWFVKWALILAAIICVIHYWLLTKNYVFNDQKIAALTRKYVVFPPHKAFTSIISELRKEYHDHIVSDNDLVWIFAKAGGWVGSICIIHASLTEYIALFGTAVDTSGHSGRFWVNITDTVLTGTFQQWQEGTLKSDTYGQGTQSFIPGAMQLLFI